MQKKKTLEIVTWHGFALNPSIIRCSGAIAMNLTVCKRQVENQNNSDEKMKKVFLDLLLEGCGK